MDKIVVCLPAIETHGKSTRPVLKREIEQGDIVLLKRFPRTSRYRERDDFAHHTAPPIFGVFNSSNHGNKMGQISLVEELSFKVTQVKLGKISIPLIERYITGEIIKGTPNIRVIPGRIVSDLYVGREEITGQLRIMDMPLLADLVSRIEIPYSI